MTMIGIYGCDSDPTITTPGSKCYKITSVAAPAEWILALCFINYLMAMSYVLWNAESIRLDTRQQGSERLAESMPELQPLVSQQFHSANTKTTPEADHWWKGALSLGAINNRRTVENQRPYAHFGQE
jgi:hypothetical protein